MRDLVVLVDVRLVAAILADGCLIPFLCLFDMLVLAIVAEGVAGTHVVDPGAETIVLGITAAVPAAILVVPVSVAATAAAVIAAVVAGTVTTTVTTTTVTTPLRTDPLAISPVNRQEATAPSQETTVTTTTTVTSTCDISSRSASAR